jgi:hypothetical protein
LSDEQRMAFYVAADGMEGVAVIKKAREMITASEAHGEFYIDGGEWLPLSVWGKRGFDEDRIKRLTLPIDVREDRVLGTTYRVKVLSTGNKGEKVVTRTSECRRRSSALPLPPTGSSSSSQPPLALLDTENPEPQPAGTATPQASGSSNGSSNNSSNDSSDTSTDTSSSSGKHKKKGKKGKRDKKSKKSKKDKKGKNSKKNKKGKKEKKEKKEKKRKQDEHLGT